MTTKTTPTNTAQPNASLPTDARRAIEAYADRLAARSGLPQPARQDARAELVSHLYDAARENAGAGPPTAAHAQAAIAALGGDAAAEATFFAQRRVHLPTATFGRRSAAYLIDFVLLAIPLAAVSFLTFAWILGGIGVALAGGFLFGYIEHRWGRTPGKALLGLRAVTASGAPLSFKEAFLRNLSKAAPPFVLADYVVGALVDKGQHLRLCDRLAGTRVVREPHEAKAPAPMVAA